MSAHPPPPGNWPGGPAGPVPPQPPQSGSRRRISWPLIAMALVTIVALVGVAYLLIVIRKDRSEGEVLLQSVASEGPFPWTPSVVPADAPTSVPPPPPGTSTLPPAAPTVADSKGGLTPVAGDQPGLYGGSNELGVCDKERLISFLEDNPDKRAAFTDVLDISDVGQYIESLTPVILTGDTRVTNHGFEDGRATPFQSVLQAGTAVLVDDRGVPRVRCGCGNPLAPATLAKSQPKYTGDSWPEFDPGRIIVVQPTSAPITQLTIISLVNGAPLVIPVMPPGAAAPAEGPESSAEWSGEYQVTSTEPASGCRYVATDTFSVSVTGAAIAIVITGEGQVTADGTMTTTDTFAAVTAYGDNLDGNFARIDNVATLNAKLQTTDPINAGCSYRYTATRRS